MRPTRSALLVVAPLLATIVTAQAEASIPEPQLGEGMRLEAGGTPIDVSVGHAAPYVLDFDGDGVRDLLVGEFGEGAFPDDRLPVATLEKWGPGAFSIGRLRVYRNLGTDAAPRFQGFEYLKAKDQHASVPTT